MKANVYCNGEMIGQATGVSISPPDLTKARTDPAIFAEFVLRGEETSPIYRLAATLRNTDDVVVMTFGEWGLLTTDRQWGYRKATSGGIEFVFARRGGLPRGWELLRLREMMELSTNLSDFKERYPRTCELAKLYEGMKWSVRWGQSLHPTVDQACSAALRARVLATMVDAQEEVLATELEASLMADWARSTWTANRVVSSSGLEWFFVSGRGFDKDWGDQPLADNVWGAFNMKSFLDEHPDYAEDLKQEQEARSSLILANPGTKVTIMGGVWDGERPETETEGDRLAAFFARSEVEEAEKLKPVKTSGVSQWMRSIMKRNGEPDSVMARLADGDEVCCDSAVLDEIQRRLRDRGLGRILVRGSGGSSEWARYVFGYRSMRPIPERMRYDLDHMDSADIHPGTVLAWALRGERAAGVTADECEAGLSAYIEREYGGW